jgi:predicted dehydrogenase
MIGCGLVADQHITQIKRIRECEIVGVCDKEKLMAEQLAARFHVKRVFTDVQNLLADARPDVVHITTPPHTHFPLGKACLEAGCSVYMEKPFTVTTAEAETLIALAEGKGLTLTAGHNLQFSPEAMRLRQLIDNGFLGGDPVHMESVQCFSHDDPTYGKALLGDRTHWVRALPGSLLQNLISHGVSKIAEFLPTENPTVIARSFTSPFLQDIQQTDITDEVRAIIHDGKNTTAYFTFSTQMGPAVNQFRIWGPVNSLVIDNTHRMFVGLKPIRYKSYLRYFLGPYVIAREFRRNTWHNIRQFLKRDFHEGYGMKVLIERFYKAVAGEAPPPIPYRQILTTSRIMDAIFEQIQPDSRLAKPLSDSRSSARRQQAREVSGA